MPSDLKYFLLNPFVLAVLIVFTYLVGGVLYLFFIPKDMFEKTKMLIPSPDGRQLLESTEWSLDAPTNSNFNVTYRYKLKQPQPFGKNTTYHRVDLSQGEHTGTLEDVEWLDNQHFKLKLVGYYKLDSGRKLKGYYLCDVRTLKTLEDCVPLKGASEEP